MESAGREEHVEELRIFQLLSVMTTCNVTWIKSLLDMEKFDLLHRTAKLSEGASQHRLVYYYFKDFILISECAQQLRAMKNNSN